MTGADERVALIRLRAAWGRDWAEARRQLVLLLAAAGREWAANEAAGFPADDDTEDRE